LGIKTFDPVDPSEVLARRAGIPEEQIIRLNANENPYGCSPKAIEALVNVPLHIYPDPLQRKVRKALADYSGIDADRIIAGAGCDELIDLLFRLLVSPGEAIIECVPTFGMYGFDARVAGARTVSVPRDELFDVDVQLVRDAVDPGTKMIFLNSPNNPTGNPVPEAQARDLLETGLVVVVDEAYYEFSGQTLAGLVFEYENLVVLRTMSKWAGLAGLRVGYGFMSPKLVKYIIDIKQPYNLNVAAEEALVASLEDSGLLLHSVGLVVDERERLFSFLENLDGVKPWPSSGNYILCEFPPGKAQTVYQGLAERGIFVRVFGHERLMDCLRVSIGTPEQMDAFTRELSTLV